MKRFAALIASAALVLSGYSAMCRYLQQLLTVRRMKIYGRLWKMLMFMHFHCAYGCD